MNATHEKAKKNFLSAAEIAGSEEQRAFLDAQWGGDEALRREVEQLLDHHRRLGSFLDSPPALNETRCGDALAHVQAGTVIGPYKLLQQTGEVPFDRERLRSAAFDEVVPIIREEEPPQLSLRFSSSQSLASIAANRHIEPRKLSGMVRGELDWIALEWLRREAESRMDSTELLTGKQQESESEESSEDEPKA